MDICRRQFGACILAGLASRAFALPARPNLSVLVLVDQLRPDTLDFGWPQFVPGGFRKLLERGAYFPDCRHLASSFSATAIATLATGAWPAQHGIVADSWYDRASRQAVRASEEDLLATTLAAQIAAEPRARVYVVSQEASHAAIFAGAPAARLFWMDEDGRFTTRGEPPDWMAEFNLRKPIQSLHDARWMAAGARTDAPPLRVLTYDPSHPQRFVALYQASPFAQAAQFDFVSELVANERLGLAGSFDFVCLIVEPGARLGYETGAASPLIGQMALELDRSLAGLLALLGNTLGEGAFNLVLAGAHGLPPEPASEARSRMAVKGEAVAEAVEEALAATGMGHVVKYVYPFFYLDSSGFRDPEPIRRAAAAAALALPQVAGYYTAGGDCSVHDAWEKRFRNSFHPRRSGDVMLSYRPEYVEDYGQGRGISYGSLYNYDIRVPLCFYGPQFRAGVFEQPVASVDVAATLARALGVAAPSSSSGRVLGEALAG